MSLTRELNKKQSPFRQLVEGCAPALAIAGGRSPEGKRVAERLPGAAAGWSDRRTAALTNCRHGLRHPHQDDAGRVRTTPERLSDGHGRLQPSPRTTVAERPAHIRRAWRRLPRSRATHQGRRRRRPGLCQHRFHLVRVPLPCRRAGNTQLAGRTPVGSEERRRGVRLDSTTHARRHRSPAHRQPAPDQALAPAHETRGVTHPSPATS